MAQENGKTSLKLTEWKYFSNAIIPAEPPHKTLSLTVADRKKLFKTFPKALLIRWHSEYDCPEQTKWWYVIKDSVYNIDSLKAKRRYEITKGRRYFAVKKISAKEYSKEIKDVWVKSVQGYSKEERERFDSSGLIQQIKAWDNEGHLSVFGAFSIENFQLCGFALVAQQNLAIHISSLKTIPEYEKFALNAALVDGILLNYNHLIEQGYYISDGARNILHSTNFQSYLEKYFEFRKVYCRLHISYRPIVRPFVVFLRPFKNLLKKFSHISIIHKIIGVLNMDTYKEKIKK